MKVLFVIRSNEIPSTAIILKYFPRVCYSILVKLAYNELLGPTKLFFITFIPFYLEGFCTRVDIWTQSQNIINFSVLTEFHWTPSFMPDDLFESYQN